MKKKYIIILAAILLLVLAVAAIYVAWAHTTALELFPEEIWEEQHDLVYWEALWDGTTVEVTGEKLQEVLNGASLWRIPSPGYATPGFPMFYLKVPGDTQEHWIYVGADGATMNGKRYIQVAENDAETFWRMFNGERNEPREVTEFEYYLDDGSLYQALLVLMEEAGVQVDS